MAKVCVICGVEGKYKCPTCLVYYCSVTCCKKHREDNCEIAQTNLTNIHNEPVYPYSTPSTVNTDKLELLKGNKKLVEMLKGNPHLRNLLSTIDKSNDPEDIMQKAMQEPLFVEFADACLEVIDPQKDED
ncbi:zinc finger HIT domain-containing protein 3 [Aethina tumida]|uniref:zinc finger HIT domain-containing protein 3 n=1 Tax=Aethina tumida TaxID=116153 RepID=UPI00096B547F|nr:zinc finger HIT domain-containing protein 3 [Aethina tumida]